MNEIWINGQTFKRHEMVFPDGKKYMTAEDAARRIQKQEEQEKEIEQKIKAALNRM